MTDGIAIAAAACEVCLMNCLLEVMLLIFKVLQISNSSYSTYKSGSVHTFFRPFVIIEQTPGARH
jgi:hypothetical protein